MSTGRQRCNHHSERDCCLCITGRNAASSYLQVLRMHLRAIGPSAPATDTNPWWEETDHHSLELHRGKRQKKRKNSSRKCSKETRTGRKQRRRLSRRKKGRSFDPCSADQQVSLGLIWSNHSNSEVDRHYPTTDPSSDELHWNDPSTTKQENNNNNNNKWSDQRRGKNDRTKTGEETGTATKRNTNWPYFDFCKILFKHFSNLDKFSFKFSFWIHIHNSIIIHRQSQCIRLEKRTNRWIMNEEFKKTGDTLFDSLIEQFQSREQAKAKNETLWTIWNFVCFEQLSQSSRSRGNELFSMFDGDRFIPSEVVENCLVIPSSNSADTPQHCELLKRSSLDSRSLSFCFVLCCPSVASDGGNGITQYEALLRTELLSQPLPPRIAQTPPRPRLPVPSPPASSSSPSASPASSSVVNVPSPSVFHYRSSPLHPTSSGAAAGSVSPHLSRAAAALTSSTQYSLSPIGNDQRNFSPLPSALPRKISTTPYKVLLFCFLLCFLLCVCLAFLLLFDPHLFVSSILHLSLSSLARLSHFIVVDSSPCCLIESRERFSISSPLPHSVSFISHRLSFFFSSRFSFV